MGVLDVFNDNVVFRLRLVVYSALVFFSFFIFVGVAVMKDNFGRCPLYLDRSSFGPASNCNFPMAIAIIFQLLYTLFRLVLLILLILGKFTTEMFFFSNIMETVFLAVDFVGFLFTFIGACILSAGHNWTCDYACVGSWVSPSKAAQAGAWISVFLWLFIVIVGFLWLFRAGRLPLIGGGQPAAGGDSSAPKTGDAPQIDTPPAYPDDTPKY